MDLFSSTRIITGIPVKGVPVFWPNGSESPSASTTTGSGDSSSTTTSTTATADYAPPSPQWDSYTQQQRLLAASQARGNVQKRNIGILGFILLSVVALAQTDNTFYVRNFAGNTIGAKLALAMKECSSDTTVPCILVLDPSLAKWANGTWPSLPVNATIADYRHGIQPISVTGAPITITSSPYNAVGDGATDNSAAIAAAVTALNAQGGGRLIIPAGKYNASSCNFTLQVPAIVEGVGSGLNDNQSTFGSAIVCSGQNDDGLVFTGNIGKVRDLAIYNTASNPTGAGIRMNGNLTHQRGSLDNVYVWGFQDDVHENGAYWDIGGGSQFTNFVRAGVYVENTVVSDEGDWNIHNSSCNSGGKTNNATTPGSSACVYIVSAGGGKITNVKSNATITHGIYLNCAGCNTNQLVITGVDIENNTNSPIYLYSSPNSYAAVSITGGHLGGPSTYPDIYLYKISDSIVSGVQMDTYGTTGNQPEAITCGESSTQPILTSNSVEMPQFTALSNSCGSRIMDIQPSANQTVSAQPTFVVGCAWTNCAYGPALKFIDQAGTASITSSYSAGGITVVVPRDGANFGGFQICAVNGTTCNFGFNTSTSTLKVTGNINATSNATLNAIAGVGTMTLATGSAAGTSPSIACTSNHTCDSVNGTVTLTTGTSPTTGTLATLTFPSSHTKYANCSVDVQQGTTRVTTVGWSESGTALTLTAGSALTASTAYTVRYWCGGN